MAAAARPRRHDGATVVRITWRRRAAVVFVCVLSLSTAAYAHLMPAQRGTLNVVGDAVFAALSLPVSGLPSVDDDHDGRLSESELTAHMPALQALLRRGVRFFNGSEPGRIDLVMPMSDANSHDGPSSAGGTQLLVLMKATFRVPPTALRFETDIFGTAANERQFALTATRGADTAAVVLTPTRHGHRFFVAPWQVALEYGQLGIRHILGGPDHLLFLLTIIVAAAGWRSWLTVLTSFTVAHSLTLALSLLDVVRVSPQIVEPLIAASIVLMAGATLWRVPPPGQRGWHVVIVFACGLLHGLGFASALGDLGLHGANRISTLVGFNVGIEVGQGIFLLGLLTLHAGIASLVRRQRPANSAAPAAWDAPLPYPRAISWIALVLAAWWMVQRTLPLLQPTG